MRKITVTAVVVLSSWAGFAWGAAVPVAAAPIASQLRPVMEHGMTIPEDSFTPFQRDSKSLSLEDAASPAAPAVSEASSSQWSDFKIKKRQDTEVVLTSLRRALAATEEKLKKSESSTLAESLRQDLILWAQLKAAIEGEEQVLAALSALADDAGPGLTAEVECGYTEAKRVKELFESMADGASGGVAAPGEASAAVAPTPTKEAVVSAIAAFTSQRGNPTDTAYLDALKNARDRLVGYYRVVIELYKDFDHMLDGLWLVSGFAFQRQKDKDLNAHAKAAAPIEASGAGADQPSAEVDRILEFLQALKSHSDKGNDLFQELYAKRPAQWQQQKLVIWEKQGTVVDREELIAQRKIDWENAKVDEAAVRQLKGQIDGLIAGAVHITDQRYKDYCKDQGRADLEKSIHEARRALEEVVDQLRAITDDNKSDASRRGVRVLLREATLLRTTHVGAFFGRVGSWFGKHLSLFKEITPLRSEFEMRLRAVSRVYPGVALVAPFVRVLANHYAPGLTDSWV